MFFESKKVVALDIGTSSIKMAQVDVGPRGAVLRKFGILPLTPGQVQGGEIIDVSNVSAAIQSLVAASKTKIRKAATAMWGNAVIVKKITMPKMEGNLIGEQLKWEAEQYIPFDINQISLDYHVLKDRSSGESMDVLLIAAKQDLMFRFIETVESAGLKCAVIDVVGFSLANCFEANYGQSGETVAIVNIGAGVTNFVVLERGEVTSSRDIMFGGSNYTSEVSKGMGVSLEEAEALKISASLGQEVPAEVHSILSSTNEQLAEEIKNSLEFFGATAIGVNVTKFYASGGGIFIPGLIEQLSKVTGLPFEPLDPFKKITYDTKAFTAEYIEQIKAISPVAIGLALRKLGDR